MKKKIILSVVFMVSLIPMCFSQYGGLKGVQEISGLINLTNPIGISAFVLFFVGVWVPFKNSIVNKVLTIIGMVGIVVSEIYEFLTWHIWTITGEMSIQNSINLTFPEFYIGLAVSLVMIIAYFAIDKLVKQ